MILGIDEAGRGPWAGPLVVGAAILGGKQIDGLTDSKKLSKKRREELYDIIKNEAVATATGWVSASELDKVGMSNALRLATRRAVEQINVSYSEIIIDGIVNFLSDTGKGRYVQTMKKADLLVPSVSAASILAKVERDRFMAEQDGLYPGYAFGSHAGYGTAKHREAIDKLGVTPLHRLSFAPLARYRTTDHREVARGDAEVASTKSIGDRAESIVADELAARGHVIVARNWRTRFCEIDIVSRCDSTFYFTEVKYRKNANQGGGLAAITAKKLRQMRFATEFFALKNNLSDANMSLAVADVAGEDFRMLDWFEVE